MMDEFIKVKNDYQIYKNGNCSQEFREELAKNIEDIKRIIYYGEFNQSDILSYIIGKEIEYSELIINKIVTNIRYQGTEVVVPTGDIPEWRASLVGNIIDEHEYGENHEIRHGTKHFTPGTKVYIAPSQWGDGGERKYVIGKSRYGFNLVEVIMDSSKIINFRAKKVYSPSVLKKMSESQIQWWGCDSETLDFLNEFALHLNGYDSECLSNERKKKLEEILDLLSKKYEVQEQKVTKIGQIYPIVDIQIDNDSIAANYYGYVHEDASNYIEYYYQISAKEIVEKIEKQIELYDEYANLKNKSEI